MIVCPQCRVEKSDAEFVKRDSKHLGSYCRECYETKSWEEVPVRTGTPDDIHPMMDLALAACEENGLTRPNPEKLLREIWSSLNLHHGIVGIIGDAGKPLEAAVLLRVEAMWYSDEMIMNERAVFVHEDFRQARGRRAAKLCDFALNAATKLGIPLVIGVLSNQRTEGKVKLYERKFGKPAGAYWIMNGHTGTVA